MNVNPEALEIRLDDLGRRVNFLFPYINSGGCCVFAAIVTAELQRLGIPARGIVASYSPVKHIDKVRPKINSNSLDEWQENGINFTHVGVEYEIDGTIKHYDSNGVREAMRQECMKVCETPGIRCCGNHYEELPVMPNFSLKPYNA